MQQLVSTDDEGSKQSYVPQARSLWESGHAVWCFPQYPRHSVFVIPSSAGAQHLEMLALMHSLIPHLLPLLHHNASALELRQITQYLILILQLLARESSH